MIPTLVQIRLGPMGETGAGRWAEDGPNPSQTKEKLVHSTTCQLLFNVVITWTHSQSQNTAGRRTASTWHGTSGMWKLPFIGRRLCRSIQNGAGRAHRSPQLTRAPNAR